MAVKPWFLRHWTKAGNLGQNKLENLIIDLTLGLATRLISFTLTPEI